MSDVFESWDRLSYGGIEFPFTEITIKGSLRHHIHEYIKRPGGEVESLARRAYTVTVRAEMMNSIVPITPFKQWVNLYPSSLSALISLFEQGLPQDLFLPNQGRVLRCKATDWTRSIFAAKRSGESVEFQFLEDSTEAFTTLNLIGATSASLLPKVAALQVEVEAIDDVPALDALDKLQNAITEYITAKDDALAVAEYQTARIDSVVARCNTLASVPSMQVSTSATANTALLSLWAVAIQIRNSQVAASRPLLGYLTPRPGMSVIDLSMDLYGSPKKAIEILRLNDFDDAFAIPRNTLVRYLAL